MPLQIPLQTVLEQALRLRQKRIVLEQALTACKIVAPSTIETPKRPPSPPRQLFGGYNLTSRHNASAQKEAERAHSSHARLLEEAQKKSTEISASRHHGYLDRKKPPTAFFQFSSAPSSAQEESRHPSFSSASSSP